ncbi:MAG: TIGR03936 family radical SAM-associated protein, partial [Thermodesulfovibrionales bacterium]
RPLRERSPERIMQIANESLRKTGYEEISLSSLSTGDYCNLIPLLKEMNRHFSEKVVSISLPSLRVASVNIDVLREIKTVRKTGFTIAPEAASERLRRVINKDFNDEDYERALHALFSEGWENLKLYFMIGLPDERDEDVEAIPEMALRAIKVAKRYSKRFVNLSVTVSPFVPKPHTPFQWLGQEPIDKIKEKLEYLKEKLSRKKINYKGHDPRMSLLEAVLSRGDSDISNLIEEAWKKGCSLDAWIDWFDFNKWKAVSETAGIDLLKYANRRFDLAEPLPWDIVDTGIKKEFLRKELKRALSEEMTPECREKCYGCGLNCISNNEVKGETKLHNLRDELRVMGEGLLVTHTSKAGSHITQQRLRVQFQKTGLLKYLSHRELMTAIIRAVRRADIPVLYSQGFHPSPRLSFGPPLNVGVSGLREYFDMEVKAGLPSNIKGSVLSLSKDRLNETLPEGIRINDVFLIKKSIPSLDSFIKRYEYEIICPGVMDISDFMSKDNLVIERETAKGKILSIDLKTMVESLQIIDKDRLRLILIDQIEKVRLNEIIKAMFGAMVPVDIIRTGLFGWDSKGNRWVEVSELLSSDTIWEDNE